jgi:hypothetical protein
MDFEKKFAGWVGLIEPCIQHSEGFGSQIEQIKAVFDYFEVPEFWREPVRVMAQGSTYYSAEDWHAKHVSNAARPVAPPVFPPPKLIP